MKYFYLILVAWSLCWMGTQIQGASNCSLASWSQVCSKFPNIGNHPSITNCSEMYYCYTSTIYPCDSSAPYYDPTTQWCTTDPSLCVNGNKTAFTNTCADNKGKSFPITINGTTVFWAFCGPDGPETELC